MMACSEPTKEEAILLQYYVEKEGKTKKNQKTNKQDVLRRLMTNGKGQVRKKIPDPVSVCLSVCLFAYTMAVHCPQGHKDSAKCLWHCLSRVEGGGGVEDS